jgi:hypothetical protein
MVFGVERGHMDLPEKARVPTLLRTLQSYRLSGFAIRRYAAVATGMPCF